MTFKRDLSPFKDITKLSRFLRIFDSDEAIEKFGEITTNFNIC